MHQWLYTNNGAGSIFLDLISKFSEAISESSISLMLFLLASGWKLHFHDAEQDENMEIHLPIIAIIGLIHLVIAALTFVDIDASHKYHDYSGMQGWSLFILKSILWLYFVCCYTESRERAKHRKD